MHERLAVFLSLLVLMAVSALVIQTGSETPAWTAPPGVVRRLQFGPDDRRFAFTLMQPNDKDHERLIVVNRESGRQCLDTTGLGPGTFCMDASGQHIAVLWADRLRLYTLVDGRCVHSIERQLIDQSLASTVDLHSMSFTDDGTTLVIATHQSTIPPVESAWDIRTGQQVKEYGRASHWIGRGLALDRSKFFGGGWPGPTPRIYDCYDGHRITYCFRHPFHIFGSFTRYSDHLLTVHEDGALFVWEVRETGDNAAIVHSATNTGLESSEAFAILHRSDTLAHIDSHGRLRYRRLSVLR